MIVEATFTIGAFFKFEVALLARFALLFLVFKLIPPDVSRSLVLVADVSDRASSTTRDLAGGIVGMASLTTVLFHV